MDPREDRTALRLRLHCNGFVPLANKNKMCLIPGWSTIEVTPEIIESREWARSRSFLDTGVRCGDVVALDWDIDDPALLNELLDAVVEQGIIDESLYVRIGRPPRELWVYRTDDRIGKRTTGKFAPKDAPPDAEGYAVEVLGAGCQFAAYGMRDTDTPYAWPSVNLLGSTYEDLPVITHAQVEALTKFCVAFFEQHGLEHRSPGGGTDSGYTHVYDLNDDMVFNVRDIGTLSLGELDDYFAANPEEVLRCSADVFRPSSGRLDSCMVSMSQGMVCISDHGTYTSHFPAEFDLGDSTEKLGLLLADRFRAELNGKTDIDFSQPLAPFDPRAKLDDNLATALRAFAYVEEQDLIYDLRRNAPGMKVDHFRNLMRPYYKEEAGVQGGRKLVWLSDLFMQHPDRFSVRTVSMRPDQPWPLYEDIRGDRHINTFRPLILPADGNAEPGFDLLTRLIPDATERRWFVQWLAYKVQHPEVRGPAVVMVAHETYGTGRGSFTALLRSMFSPGLVQSVDFNTLTGKTYQSQYNEWMADSLIVTVNEAQEDAANLSRWAARHNAYERLKEIVDPAENNIQIVRKGQPNYQGRTYASIIVMTNHADSLVIPANDRRFAVLTNGSPPSADYWEFFHTWRRDLRNVGAFIDALHKVDMEGYSPFVAPPMTLGKLEMVESGTSELDRALSHALGQFDNTIIVKEQVILKIEDYLADNNVEVPDDWRRAVERMFLRKTRRLEHIERVRIDGRQRVVRVIGSVDSKVLQSHTTVIEEVLRNGPLSRPLSASTAKVIRFPGNTA